MKLKTAFHLTLFVGCILSYALRVSAPDTSHLDTWAEEPAKRPQKIAARPIRPAKKGNPLAMNNAAVAPVQPAQPVVAHPPKAQDPAPVVKASDDAMAFSRQLSETWSTMPRVESVKHLNESQIHHAPPEVYEAGGKIGAISAKVHENPALVPQAMDFFDRCARDKSFLQSSRVLCYRNLKFWSNATGLKIPREEEFARELPQLAAQLPPVRLGTRPQ